MSPAGGCGCQVQPQRGLEAGYIVSTKAALPALHVAPLVLPLETLHLLCTLFTDCTLFKTDASEMLAVAVTGPWDSCHV